MILIHILAGVALLQSLFTLLDSIRAARYMRTFRPRRKAQERVVVFCPCKGIDPEFEKNVQSILNQDYPHYAVRFVVESEDDAAFERLRGLGCSVLVAGRAACCGQKVHNLAYAVRQCGASADVYVFCDSDARYPSGWLSRLIAPLDSHGITTGYRWYASSRFHLPTLMRSAWNASSLSVLGDHNRNFAWGGSTAIRREAFERLNILDAWRGALSDDYAITRAAQKAGVKIVFVPECLVPSYGECTFREMLEFSTRQIIITRVYHRVLWRVGLAGHLIFNAAFWILPFFHPLIWLAIFSMSAARSWIRCAAVRTVLQAPALPRPAWFYILSSPFVALLYAYNMIASMLSTEIVWLDIRYKLISPSETLVLSGPFARSVNTSHPGAT